MLRAPIDDAERSAAESSLGEARALMVRALTLLDGTPVATDCDCHLDQAIHAVTETLADVRSGAAIFIDRHRAGLAAHEAEPRSNEPGDHRSAQMGQGEPFA